METLKTIWNFLFNHKTICGKQKIEESMTEKYGKDWLEQCLKGLKNPSVRTNLKKTLKLQQAYYLYTLLGTVNYVTKKKYRQRKKVWIQKIKNL